MLPKEKTTRKNERDIEKMTKKEDSTRINVIFIWIQFPRKGPHKEKEKKPPFSCYNNKERLEKKDKTFSEQSDPQTLAK
jgi:hypothetical protein